jgi:hypothetical protein
MTTKSMLTEDYFMRMINQMLAVLNQILYHREAGQYQEAQELIDQSLEQLLGVPPYLLKQMDDLSLLRLLTTQGELDPDRLAMVANLYKLEGDLLIDQNKNQEAVLDYQRALTFYLEIRLSGKDQGQNDLDGNINDLYRKLSGRKLPLEVRIQLFDYYDKQGDYLLVEEQITNLLKHDDQYREILPGIIAYYEAKLALTDQELTAGGVSRQQLTVGLEAVIGLGDQT